MSQQDSSPLLPTVSYALIEDWIAALHSYCPPSQVHSLLTRVDLDDAPGPQARVTHDQIVRLYKLAAVETKDEMTGLWSRPVRNGALKHLCASVRGASSLSTALFRFTSFWNLLLDDFELSFDNQGGVLCIRLIPRIPNVMVPRFGPMLLLKLAHGIASWLMGREMPLTAVRFAFPRPAFAEDYAILFPAPISFEAVYSEVLFDGAAGGLPVSRSDAETQIFLERAPRDWIFTSFRQHTLALRIRETLLSSDRLEPELRDIAAAMNLTPRTLMRRLERETTSFQEIKDGLRRDMAMRDLREGVKSVEAISQDLGFASAANFHRAFKRWSDLTPGAFRRRAKQGGL